MRRHGGEEKHSEKKQIPEDGTVSSVKEARLLSVLQISALLATPAALATAALFFLGYIYTSWVFYPFGIDAALLGRSRQLYVIRSVGTLLVPLITVGAAGLVLSLVHWGLKHWLLSGQRRWALRSIGWTIVALGVVQFAFLTMPFLSDLRIQYLGGYHTWALIGPAVALTMYGALLAHKVQNRQSLQFFVRRRIPLPSLVFISLMLFASILLLAGDYCRLQGMRAGLRILGHPENLPSVTVYSKVPLNLDMEGVVVQQVGKEEVGYSFRYRGLRLLASGEGIYFLFPERALGRPQTVMLRDNDSLRFELSLFSYYSRGSTPDSSGKP